MTCPRTQLIVRLVAGELSEREELELRKHLEACEACATAYAELCHTWDSLGSWQPRPFGIDLTSRILARTNDAAPVRDHAIRVESRRKVFLRAAASIALALGLGIAAGRLVPAGAFTTVPEPPPTLENLTEALELIGLAPESATGLPLDLELDDAIMGDESP